MSTFNISGFLVKNSGLPGYDLLTEEELYSFIDGIVDSNPVTISNAISLYIDIYNAYELSEIKYYRSGESNITIEISIGGDTWDEVTYDSYDTYISVYDIFHSEDFMSWPRFIRINHSKVSSDVYGYEIVIVSKDTGDMTYMSLGSVESVETDNSVPSEVTEIFLFNKSGEQKDIYCLLESFIDYDPTGVALAPTSSGVFNRIYEKGLRIPRDYSWSAGTSFGLVASGTGLATEATSGTGYYYSPVFNIENFLPARIYFQYTSLSGAYVDWNDYQVDSSNTIGIRLYNFPPDSPWENGDMPSESDSAWSINGAIPFTPTPCNAMLGGMLGRGNYIQFAAKLNTPILGYSGVLEYLGIEESTVISGVPNGGYLSIYVKTNISGSSQSSYTNLLTFVLD